MNVLFLHHPSLQPHTFEAHIQVLLQQWAMSTNGLYGSINDKQASTQPYRVLSMATNDGWLLQQVKLPAIIKKHHITHIVTPFAIKKASLVQRVIIYRKDVTTDTPCLFETPLPAGITATNTQLWSPANHLICKPYAWETAEQIRLNYTNGHLFFLAYSHGDATAYIALLKGFSGFKKWQHSSMYLILWISDTNIATIITEKLITYKYRDSVAIVTDGEALIPYAYAVISDGNTFTARLHAALAAKVPVLQQEHEYIVPGVTYYNTHEQTTLAKQMIYLYKSELQLTAFTSAGYNYNSSLPTIAQQVQAFDSFLS
ncbi:MAG TPA: hypothetical protein DCL43_14630 [Chitinophagaceae bacterium]|nr:hypothetical protein [Chitinophagaceae bacterium]HAN37854.1 hypothetical protein [Chitinophagaceae bacterium]